MNKDGKISPIVKFGLYLFGFIVLVGLIGSIQADPKGVLISLMSNWLFWIAFILVVAVLIVKFVHIEIEKYHFYGYLFILAGVLALSWSVFEYFQLTSFQASEIKTVGTIVSLEKRLVGGRTKSDVDIPTIVFKTTDGRTFTFGNNVELSPGEYHINDRISVVYDKNDPNIAYTSDNFLILNIVFSILLGLLCFFMSWAIFMSLKKKLLPPPINNSQTLQR